MPDIGKHLAAACPNRKIATRTAPKWLLRTRALFDPSIKMTLPPFGHHPEFDTSATTQDITFTFTPASAALDRAAATPTVAKL